jgi:FixJ family two-component response regulator
MTYAIGPIIIVDDDVSRRAAISFALTQANVHCEPHESLDELFASRSKNGVLLVHDGNGMVASVVKHLKSREQSLPVLAYSTSVEPARIVEVIRNGALDYLVWPFQLEDILHALESIDVVESKATSIRSFGNGRVEDYHLTAREREVLAAAAEGLRNTEIGRKLEISARTVEVHRANAYKKIGARNISEALHLLFGVKFAA